MVPSIPQAEIIDVEVIERYDQAGDESAPLLRLPPAPSSRTLPPLFTLPPELDPQRLVAQQRARLEQMLAPPSATSSSEAEASPLESSDAFLARAMSLLDAHVEMMERTLERVVGKHFVAPASDDNLSRRSSSKR